MNPFFLENDPPRGSGDSQLWNDAKHRSGVRLPDSEVLSAVADALDQDLDFFFRPQTKGAALLNEPLADFRERLAAVE